MLNDEVKRIRRSIFKIRCLILLFFISPLTSCEFDRLCDLREKSLRNFVVDFKTGDSKNFGVRHLAGNQFKIRCSILLFFLSQQNPLPYREC